MGVAPNNYNGFVVAALRLALVKGDVVAIIHAFNLGAQSHAQMRRVFGSASGVDPLKGKKTKTSCKMHERNVPCCQQFAEKKLALQRPHTHHVNPCPPPSKNRPPHGKCST